MTSRLAFSVILALAVALPGCAGPGLEAFSLASIVEPLHPELTWPDPLSYDASGIWRGLPPSLLGDRLPVAVEQEVTAGAGNPNVGITRSGAIYVTVGDAVYRSPDQGRTWNVTYELISPVFPLLQDKFTSPNPMLWIDADTDRVFAAHGHPVTTCTYMAWTDDDGEAWTHRPMGCFAPYVWNQKLMTAKPGPRAPPGLEPTLYENVLYLCYEKTLVVIHATYCSVSYDGGLTWAYEKEAYAENEMCENRPGHPAAYPDGTVAFAMGRQLPGLCKRPFTIVLSEDNGLTWQTRTCAPDRYQIEMDADLTVTPDGTAYAVFRDLDQRVYLARSKDKFQSCDVFPVSPANHTLNVFTAITSGDDGRIAMAYLGTEDPQGPGTSTGNATPGTKWHAYVTVSHDADAENPTFVTMQVTPREDPVQVGCIWMYDAWTSCTNLFDFIDMGRDAEGRYYVALTDGCTPRNGCGGRPNSESDFQSRDSQVVLLVQERGASLFAEKGILPPLGLEPPRVR